MQRSSHHSAVYDGGAGQLFIRHQLSGWDPLKLSFIVTDVDQNDLPLLMAVSSMHTPGFQSSLRLTMSPAK